MIQDLKNKLAEQENAIQHLLRTKSTLEQDLSIKNNTLNIDRERCLGNRKTYPSIKGGHTNSTVPFQSQMAVY